MTEADHPPTSPSPTNPPMYSGSASSIAVSRYEQSPLMLKVAGFLFIIIAICSFGAVIYLAVVPSRFIGSILASPEPPRTTGVTWQEVVLSQTTNIVFIIVGIISALFGSRLLQVGSTQQTVPEEDVQLIQQAVVDGKPEPIDQYLRLRSLSGFTGYFTQLGITGLPLTTVFLTLTFATISLSIGQSSEYKELSQQFMDLTKLTLGAFIGSYVQRQVEQRGVLTDEISRTIQKIAGKDKNTLQ